MEIGVEVLTDEGWKEIIINVTIDSNMDLLDREISITEYITKWCSDNGYSYECWDYLDDDIWVI